MDMMKLLMLFAFTIGLFHCSQSQDAICRKICAPGLTCRVYHFRCNNPPCRSFEYCIRPSRTQSRVTTARTTTTTTTTTTTAAPVQSNRNGQFSFRGSIPGLNFAFDCSTKQCLDGEYCAMVGKSCITFPCRPLPVCKKIVKRPGTCPSVSVSRMQNDCTSECASDDQCPDNEKCCMEGCKKKCMAPQSEVADPVKIGFCPDFPEVTLSDCTAECSDDDSCGTNEKCCKYSCSMRCVEQLNTTEPEVKPNSCPIGLPHPSDEECTINCRVDNDCPNTEKCCTSGCSMSCRSPLAILDDRPNIRPGYCPTTVPDGPCKKNCTFDSRCPGEQKCCELGCHKICVDPLTPPFEKKGKCPQPSRRSFTCKEDCRFDDTCPGEQKCCQDGCVSTCEDPIVDTPQSDGRVSVSKPTEEDEPAPAANQRPGTCPAPNTSSFKCRDRCGQDDECPGQMKCCFFRCGKKCLNVLIPGVGRDCGRDSCASDASCPGNKVCRSTGCGKVCLDPPQSSRSKAGSCPNFPRNFRVVSCTDNCESDDNCTGTRKCCSYGPCKRCFIPTGNVFRAAPKPSQCPDMPATSNLTSCEPVCSSDRACSGGQICCPYGCSTKCQDPVTKTPMVKAGYCPSTPANVRSFTCFKACSIDSDCPGNAKCCANGCNTRCVVPRKTAPKSSKPGYCPANDINSPTTNCESKCSDDYACGQNEKCCFNGCRRECVPVVRSAAPRKPGFCPLSAPSRITSYNHFLAQDCGHFCNSDFACPGELKCCRQGCKSSCIAKQSQPAPMVKEGYCPATTQSFGTCERRCNSDISCSGNQKCCFEGTCSQKCVNPISTPPTPRPGFCPNVPQLPAEQCRSSTEFCNSDHACPEPLKCCFDGCNNRCINPESSTMSTKEGFCPSFSLDASSECRVDCTSDDSCPDDQKCCSVGCAVKCVQPNQSPPKDKAGFCPFIPTSLSSSCQQSCQLDDSCPGIMKCCQNGCSRKCYNPVAMPPAIAKAGYCPAPNSNLQCDEPCTSDGSCAGNKKCCQLSCGMSCVDPDTNHPGVKLGFCPFVNPNVSTMCLKTCSSDYSCGGDTKCCSFGQCSMRCMAPSAAPEAQRKTGDCPSSGGARGRPDSIQCISDYSCPGNEKCCRIGNAVQCSAPAQDSAMKDGACPALTTTSLACIRRCASDSNCPGNQKCCPAGCSSRCAAPSFSDAPRTNSGHCPYVEPHVLLPCTVNCTADADCGDGMKCCEYGCGMRCLRSQPFPPTTQKDGSCPSQPAVNPLYVVPNGRFWFRTEETPSRETFGYRNCRNDGQCPGTLKCCASSVGGTECITPV